MDVAIIINCMWNVNWIFFLFFSIVNENGASIYSGSAQAKKEMPDLDINIISAGMLCYFAEILIY